MDARKYDVDDEVTIGWQLVKGKQVPKVGKVLGVRYHEDVDGIRHSYSYILDTGESEMEDMRDESGKLVIDADGKPMQVKLPNIVIELNSKEINEFVDSPQHLQEG